MTAAPTTTRSTLQSKQAKNDLHLQQLYWSHNHLALACAKYSVWPGGLIHAIFACQADISQQHWHLSALLCVLLFENQHLSTCCDSVEQHQQSEDV
jgi:hypothetical protein